MKKLLLIALISASIGAHADSKTYKQCLNRTEGITVEILNCTAAEAEWQDARLNANYKKTMASLSGAKKQDLLTAQRLWLKQHRELCDAAVNPEGGSAETMVLNDCYLQEITKRADYLEDMGKKTATK